jgi:hypothetical protein
MRDFKNIIFLLLLLPLLVKAQKRDTLAPFRAFVQACDLYKQLPLQLHVSIKSHVNYVTSKEDTLSSEAIFSFSNDGAYIEMEGLEQLVSDSLVLIVNKPAKRMLVYSNAQSVASRLQASTGLFLPDSSLSKLAKRYTAQATAAINDTARFLLESRTNVYNTSIPKETVELVFDNKTNQPISVNTTKRSLIALEQSTYQSLQKEPALANKLLVSPDAAHYFLVKEQTVVYSYQRISHNDKALPAYIKDRIVRNSTSDGFVAAAGFEEYQITKNM